MPIRAYSDKSFIFVFGYFFLFFYFHSELVSFFELLRQFQSLLHGLHLVVETEEIWLLSLLKCVLIAEISQYSFGLGSILERSF